MFSFLSRVGVGRGSVLKSSAEKVVFGDVEDVFFELEHVEIDADGDAFHDARDGEGVGDAIGHLRYREIATQASLLVFSPQSAFAVLTLGELCAHGVL